MFPRIHRLAAWVLLFGLACLTGCKTTDTAHTGHAASVEISGHTKAEIQQAATKVFQAHGYTKISDLIFEKPGSVWDTANYGGWSSSPVWIRIKCDLESTDTHQYVLGCDAYIVEGHGEVGTEVERKLWFSRRSECKAILNEIKSFLKKHQTSETSTNKTSSSSP